MPLIRTAACTGLDSGSHVQGRARLGEVPSARRFRKDEDSGWMRAEGKVEEGVTMTLCRG